MGGVVDQLQAADGAFVGMVEVDGDGEPGVVEAEIRGGILRGPQRMNE